MFTKSKPSYLLAFLLTSIVLRIFANLFFQIDYWGDEALVSLISKQNIGHLFNTILAEPHPPLFYLLLKLLPVNNHIFTKNLIILLSTLSTMVVTHYGSKRGIFKKYRLSYGLALFFCSTTFLTISSDLKQDSLSFPILFLLFLITLDVNLNNKLKIFASSTLLSLLLLVGYIPFFWGLALISGYCFLNSRYKSLLITVIALLPVLFLYYVSFWREQIINNLNRFEWSNYESNNPLLSLTFHIAGPSNMLFVLFGLLFVLFAGIEFSKSFIKSRKKVLILLLVTIILVVPLHARWFVRARYVYPIFALVGIFVGRFLEKKLPNKLLLIILTGAFIIGFTGYTQHKLTMRDFDRDLAIKLSRASANEEILFISNAPLLAKVFTNVYLKTNNVVPVDSLTMVPYADPNYFVKEDLLVSQPNYERGFEKNGILRKYSQIAYFHIIYNGKQDNELLELLELRCQLSLKESVSHSADFYIYKSCN